MWRGEWSEEGRGRRGKRKNRKYLYPQQKQLERNTNSNLLLDFENYMIPALLMKYTAMSIGSAVLSSHQIHSN